MNKYILIHERRDVDNPVPMVKEGHAQTEVQFLENIDEKILSEHEWRVHEVIRSTSRKVYIHSGQIDHVLSEYND